MARPRGHSLDAVDLNLIVGLEDDGRLEIEKLGKKIGIGYTPCRRRLNRLLSAGYISIEAIVSPTKSRWSSVQFVLVQFPQNDKISLETFAKGTLAMKNVLSCDQISGPWDFLMRVAARDIQQFEEVRRSIAAIVKGSRTETIQIVASVKAFRLPAESLFS